MLKDIYIYIYYVWVKLLQLLGKSIIYIYGTPPHGPWFGVFNLYCPVFYVFFASWSCVKIWGCHIHVRHACMQTDVIKAMTSASAI